MSEEHVFCLEDGCGWEEELCWEKKCRLTGDPKDPNTVMLQFNCLRLYGHDDCHASIDSEGQLQEWHKDFSISPSRNPSLSLYEELYGPGSRYSPSMFPTKPAEPWKDQYERMRRLAFRMQAPVGTQIHSPPIDVLLDDAKHPSPSITFDSPWYEEPKTASATMKLVRPRTVVFDTETTYSDKWDMKLSPSGDIKFVDYGLSLLEEHYKYSTLAALVGLPKNVMYLHDEIQASVPRIDTAQALAIIDSLHESPEQKEKARRLELRIEENRLKKFHCPDCGSHLIKKFGTPWCQKCDKAVRDPDKR